MTAKLLYLLALPLLACNSIKKASATPAGESYMISVDFRGGALDELMHRALAVALPCDVEVYENGSSLYTQQGVRLHYTRLEAYEVNLLQTTIVTCRGVLDVTISKDTEYK